MVEVRNMDNPNKMRTKATMPRPKVAITAKKTTQEETIIHENRTTSKIVSLEKAPPWYSDTTKIITEKGERAKGKLSVTMSSYLVCVTIAQEVKQSWHKDEEWSQPKLELRKAFSHFLYSSLHQCQHLCWHRQKRQEK